MEVIDFIIRDIRNGADIRCTKIPDNYSKILEYESSLSDTKRIIIAGMNSIFYLSLNI
jgi:hypothetical protein